MVLRIECVGAAALALLAVTAPLAAQTPVGDPSSEPSLSSPDTVLSAPASRPGLRALAPPPDEVVELADSETGPAEITPPTPKIITRGAGKVVVPGKKQFAAGGFVREDVVSSTLKINSNFGWRHGRMHTGVDLDGDTGQRVGASMAGIVKFAGHKRGYGNLIVLDHGHGINTYYAHLSAILVELEAPIEAGQVIGLVGSTGRSSGPHLHYEVRANGKPLNPFGTIVLDEDKVWVDGQLVTAPAGDEWGDAEEAAEPGGEPARTVRIPARQPRSVPTKKIIVYGSDSLTEY